MKKLLIATILSTTTIAASAAEAEKVVKATPIVEEAKKEVTYPPKVTFEEAKTIAVKAVKGSVEATEAELELEEDGEFTYEVSVEAGGVETEVEIDAQTGEVLEMEADD